MLYIYIFDLYIYILFFWGAAICKAFFWRIRNIRRGGDKAILNLCTTFVWPTLHEAPIVEHLRKELFPSSPISE